MLRCKEKAPSGSASLVGNLKREEFSPRVRGAVGLLLSAGVDVGVLAHSCRYAFASGPDVLEAFEKISYLEAFV